MTVKLYRRWDWDCDCGRGEIAPGEAVPASHAVAYFDDRGRLYRVMARVKWSADRPSDDPEAFDVSAYDYFCDDQGRIVEKRSLDEDGLPMTLVRYEYSDSGSPAAQSAWSPDANERVYLRP